MWSFNIKSILATRIKQYVRLWAPWRHVLLPLHDSVHSCTIISNLITKRFLLIWNNNYKRGSAVSKEKHENPSDPGFTAKCSDGIHLTLKKIHSHFLCRVYGLSSHGRFAFPHIQYYIDCFCFWVYIREFVFMCDMGGWNNTTRNLCIEYKTLQSWKNGFESHVLRCTTKIPECNYIHIGLYEFWATNERGLLG